MNKNFSPKISVIIPLFNAEKYLGACLESLFIQTLKDFEVIIVDDCSTDNSVAIAENYRKKFGERLKIISLPRNTGNPAVPRNIGLEHARGEYIYFVDSDDLLANIALETLYNFAEEYQADVVSMEAGFSCDEEPLPKYITKQSWTLEKNFHANEPVLGIEDFDERLENFRGSAFEWVPWSKFLRREFLAENDITFPAMKSFEDVVWALELILTAKRWLRINVPLYVQRKVSNSLSRRRLSPEQSIVLRINALIDGANHLEKFMSTREFFKQNLSLRLEALITFITARIDGMHHAFKVLNPIESYGILLREFSKAGDSQTVLSSCLFLLTDIYRNELRK